MHSSTLKNPDVLRGGDVFPQTPRTAAMAGSGCALQGNHTLNPALLTAALTSLEAHWVPARFGLPELGSAGCAYTRRWTASGMRAALQHFGFQAYREMQLSVGGGIALGEKLAGGSTIRYTHVSMLRYGSGYAVGIDIGVRMKLSEQLSCGAVAENVAQLPFAKEERLPITMKLGTALEQGAFRVACDFVKQSRFPAVFVLGVEYRLLDILSLRAGASTIPGIASGGAGVQWGQWEIGYAVSAHPDLGWTHTAGIGFRP
ncbi:hypothetical protein KQI65_14560 [bacterium]|nr:hypothetical protein [bacterium]